MIEEIQASFDDIANESYTDLHNVLKCPDIDKDVRNTILVNLLRVEKTASAASRNLQSILDKLEKRAEAEKTKREKFTIE